MLLAAFLVGLLCLTNHATGQSSCETDAPDNCAFNDGFCDWLRNDSWYTVAGTSNGVALLNFGKREGRLTSRKACSTQGKQHCFQFEYLLRNASVVELSVWINDGGEEKVVWKLTPNSPAKLYGTRQAARVPIVTKGAFVVIIEGKRYGDNSNEGYIAVDDIIYTESSCTLKPKEAKPGSTYQTPKAGVGSIIGVVVAVLVAFGVAATLAILLRRKQLCFSKTVSRSSDTALRNLTNMGYSNHELETSLTQPSNNLYSVAIEGNVYSKLDSNREPSSSTVGQSGQSNPVSLYSVATLTNDAKKGQQPNPAGIFSQSQVWEYNSLDFDGKKAVSGKNWASGKTCNPGKTGGASERIYNHLNEGGEDTYSEVDREKRMEVIDGEYSHIKL